MISEKLSIQPFYQSDLAEISFLPKAGVLWLTWKEKGSSPIIQEVYERLFGQMQSRQVKYILIDISRRGRASAADETWMMREFVPRLMQLFSEGIHLAYLLNTKHYQELLEESPNGSLESLSQLLSMHYFREEGKALEWLAAKQMQAAI